MFIRRYRWMVLPDDRPRFQHEWEDEVVVAFDSVGLLGSLLLTVPRSNEVVAEFRFESEKAGTAWSKRQEVYRFFNGWKHIQIGGVERYLVVKSLLPEEGPETGLTMERIRNAVAARCEVSTSKIMSRARRDDVAFARQVTMWFCKKFTPRSFPDIGRYLGRDHSTVMHGYRKVSKMLTKKERWFKSNRLLSEVVDELKVELGIA